MKNFLLILCALAWTSCSVNSKNEIKQKPNIVIILADDQGWGDLSISGNSNITTPNIDKLATSGAIFDRFYVCPVCSPTRAEMLTGRYHVRGGVYSTSAGGERLDLDETTIAEIFKKAGYKTAAYGKWHNGMQAPYHPNLRGFDDFYGFCSGHWGNYFNPMLEHNGEIVQGNGFTTDDFTSHGLQFIEENKDNPFFLYLPYNTPHSPMQAPDMWWNKFKDKELEMLYRDKDKEDVSFTRAALAMCENIDWNVGRVMDKLQELNLEENTIVIYFSDNGPNAYRWNGGMKGKKGTTDEGGVRSPFCLRWTGSVQAGVKIEQIAGAIDILPTLADLTGVKIPDNLKLDGVSLKPLLEGKQSSWEDRVIINNWKTKISVRGQQYKLDDDDRLYDMVNDYGQTKDISDEQPEVKERLLQEKMKFKNEIYSELPKVDNRTFTIGHPDFIFTQIPARDGTAHGNIERSNKYPNCSFFTNWVSLDDSITWAAEVLTEGDYQVDLYYTCKTEDVGAIVALSFNDQQIETKITEAFDPPLKGMENDRYERMESYVKDFKKIDMGIIHLNKGEGLLSLKALAMPGAHVIDFRLLNLKRVN